MSLTIKIIIAVVAVIIVLRWMMGRAKPRMHHYLFCHGLLPNITLSKPDEVLSSLLSPTGHSREGERFLIDLWMEAGKDLPENKHIATTGLTYAMDVLHSPRSAAYIIHLPTPERPLECYFAAIVFDSVAFAAGHPAGVRYFTLERSFCGCALIGESRSSAAGELERIDHGEAPGADKESFLTGLRKIITDNTRLDASPDQPASAT